MTINVQTVCPICNHNFATNNGLRIHFSIRHPNDPYPFKMSWYDKSKESWKRKKQNELQT